MVLTDQVYSYKYTPNHQTTKPIDRIFNLSLFVFKNFASGFDLGVQSQMMNKQLLLTKCQLTGKQMQQEHCCVSKAFLVVCEKFINHCSLEGDLFCGAATLSNIILVSLLRWIKRCKPSDWSHNTSYIVVSPYNQPAGDNYSRGFYLSEHTGCNWLYAGHFKPFKTF